MSKHTPGPWGLRTHKDEDGNMLFCRIVDDHNREVANTATGNFGDENEYANAHLIAAAPAMLEALETAERLTTDMMILAGLREAIKKAKGQNE